jgi:hypothetical protein
MVLAAPFMTMIMPPWSKPATNAAATTRMQVVLSWLTRSRYNPNRLKSIGNPDAG